MFTSQKYHIALILFILLVGGILPASTQDAEVTEEPIPTVFTATPTATPHSPTIVQATVTATPSFTHTIQPTLTSSPTITPMQAISATIVSSVSGTESVTPTSTNTPMIELTEEVLPISSTTPEVPVDMVTPTLTAVSATMTPISGTLVPISASATSVAFTQTPISNTIVSISPTLTSVSTTITPTIMPSISATQITSTVTPTIQPTATIGGLPLRYIQGIARYQNRVTDDSGILLQVYGEDLTLISETTTNEQGIYNLPVPIDEAFWVVFSAEGHLTERLYIAEADSLADVTLLAGDLNADDCINFNDMNLLQQSEGEQSDFNDDDEENLSDVAMLAGNLNPDCGSTIPVTITPTILSGVSSTSTETPVYTPTPLTSISSTVTEVATPIIEQTEEAMSEAETTEEP